MGLRKDRRMEESNDERYRTLEEFVEEDSSSRGIGEVRMDGHPRVVHHDR